MLILCKYSFNGKPDCPIFLGLIACASVSLVYDIGVGEVVSFKYLIINMGRGFEINMRGYIKNIYYI